MAEQKGVLQLEVVSATLQKQSEYRVKVCLLKRL